MLRRLTIARLPLPLLLLSLGLRLPAAEPIAHPIAGPGNLELHPDLEISLFAREPDVVDPVALAFDELGRAFVVEMRDYPYGLGPDRRPGGTIRLLEDTDGDGRADRSTLFAEGLSFPTSITVWRGGVLVTAPPDIVFLKDVDGDGKAEVREVAISGFRLGATDSNVNGLRFGPDNWIHGVNGGNGGLLRSPKRPGGELRLGDRDFRFRPDTGEIEPTTHTGGGFGLVFDAWGHSFTPYNINHIQMRVAEADAFARYPGLPPVETTHGISDHGDMARIYPISTAQTRPNHPEQAGYFSAAGGMGFLGHSGWPGDLPDSVLVGDVVGNLVHRDRLIPDGPIFRATRAPAETTREFLASRDNSFRPVGLEMGPDGGLYLLDMQRDVIEHPDYIPKKLLAKQDLRAGDDRGRIYRIAPKRWPRTRELPGRATPEALVALLNSPNPWTQATAQRLLVERPNRTVVPQLAEVLRAPAGSTPDAGRIRALWTLHGLGALTEPLLLQSLGTLGSAGAVESWLAASASFLPGTGALQNAVRDQLQHANAAVRFRAALAAGRIPGAETTRSLTQYLARDGTNTWMRRAALASLPPGDEVVALDVLLANPALGSAGTAPVAGPVPDLLRDLADLAGVRLDPSAATAPELDRVWAPWARWLERPELGGPARLALLDGWRRGWERADSARIPAPSPALSAMLRRQLDPEQPRLLTAAWPLARRLGLSETEGMKAALARALRLAQDSSQVTERRLEALDLLDLGAATESIPVFLALLQGNQPGEVRNAAFRHLREHREGEVGKGLVQAWGTLPPALRPDAVNLLVYRHAFHPALLDALDGGHLPIGELNLDLEHRRELLRKAKLEIRERAAKHMSDEEYSNRSAVVDQWLAKLPATGEAAPGRPIFERLCAPCHRVQDLGHHVGPELTGMSHRSVEDLLSNILDPNMAMNPAFVAYTAELTDGEQETGLLRSENAESVTLLQAQDRVVEIPRRRIQQLRANGRSLMPEGLEAGLTPRELRDLIAFLQEPAPQPK